jgi:hypothetical protein
MQTLLAAALLLCVTSTGHPASHLLAWDAQGLTTADVGFRVERCTNTRTGCPMQFLTNLPRTTREYLDQTVRKKDAVCYRMKATTSPYSNVVCTP